jgi:hypothetical protein
MMLNLIATCIYETTFGKVKADVLADKDSAFQRGSFCSVIRNSSWRR